MDESGGFAGLDPKHLKFPDRNFIFSSTTANFPFKIVLRMVPSLCGVLTKVVTNNVLLYVFH